MTRLLIESEGVIISPDTPVIKHNPDPIDEYIVIVNLPEDWEEVHNACSAKEIHVETSKADDVTTTRTYDKTKPPTRWPD